MVLWQFLKESPGAIQRYYPRLLCVSDGIMTSTLKKAQEQSKGTIQDYWHTVMAYDSTLKKAQEQS